MEHLLRGRDLVGWPLPWTPLILLSTLLSTHLGTHLCPPWAQISTSYQPLAGEKPYCSWPCDNQAIVPHWGPTMVGMIHPASSKENHVSWRVEPHLSGGCYLVRECPCNQCEYKATTQSRLKIQIESVHEYPCNQWLFMWNMVSKIKF